MAKVKDLPAKALKAKYVRKSDLTSQKTHRVTFTCSIEDYAEIVDRITDYGIILVEEECTEVIQ